MHKLTLALCLLLSMVVAAATPALASSDQGEDVKMLMQEIKALKAKLAEMDQLKKKVDELEKKLATSDKKQKDLEKMTVATKKALEPGAKEPKIKVGGALRFNYRNTSFNDAQKSKGGDGTFDIFRLDVDGKYNDLIISAQYRWYSYMNVIHHGWVGYDFNDHSQGQLGITQVPFGLLPYASHNWWFGVPYYLGLADDYDMGGKWKYTPGPWDLQLAFFKNGEWGNAGKLERYSFDVVTSGDQQNEETNTVNARLAYTFKPAAKTSIEVGVSGMFGQLYNNTSDSSGTRWAVGPHVNAKFGQFGVQLEAVRYQYNPDNPDGVSDDTVLLGAFASSYPVASEATVLVGNLSYDVPVKWGPITGLQFYNDFSMSMKEKSGWEDSYINTLGCLISSGPIYTYVDLVMGKNMVWLGGPSNALAEGDPNAEWTALFNINVGYYF
ncbi:MAG: hypothetical protein KQI62_11270 [Deltaproteobacteria bacterium]|nr:hypothetical protein [Deltaproteobacteria bacterium]